LGITGTSVLTYSSDHKHMTTPLSLLDCLLTYRCSQSIVLSYTLGLSVPT